MSTANRFNSRLFSTFKYALQMLPKSIRKDKSFYPDKALVEGSEVVGLFNDLVLEFKMFNR